MRVAIMQPYLFPYIGYYQLMECADVFVVYDDVNYIKGGWINRNRILIDAKPHTFTLPLTDQSPYKKISELSISDREGGRAQRRKLIKTFRQVYCNAPHFADISPLIEGILSSEELNLAGFLEQSLTAMAGHLGVRARLIRSSAIEKTPDLKGQDRVIDICRVLGATEYVNAIGGLQLYEPQAFMDSGIRLGFIKAREISYAQFGAEFVPNLSIIDMLMFCDSDRVRGFLKQYDILWPGVSDA